MLSVRPLIVWHRVSPFSVLKRSESAVPVPEGKPDSTEDARNRVCECFGYLLLGSIAFHSRFENIR